MSTYILFASYLARGVIYTMYAHPQSLMPHALPSTHALTTPTHSHSLNSSLHVLTLNPTNSLGAIMFALSHDPPFVPKFYVAGGIIAGGILNICYFPFYWKYQRRRATAKKREVVMEPYPEELIYGMNTQYIRNDVPQQVPATPEPAGAAPSSQVGASPTVAASPATTPSTSPATVNREKDYIKSLESGKELEMKKFADEIQITVEPLGAGAGAS
jgi:hypothetical protein